MISNYEKVDLIRQQMRKIELKKEQRAFKIKAHLMEVEDKKFKQQ